MKVIKKDGRLQDFDIKKIILSIERASDDVKESMNESDGENIAHLIVRKLDKLAVDEIESTKLKKIILDSLYELGFKDIAEGYFKGEK